MPFQREQKHQYPKHICSNRVHNMQSAQNFGMKCSKKKQNKKQLQDRRKKKKKTEREEKRKDKRRKRGKNRINKMKQMFTYVLIS